MIRTSLEPTAVEWLDGLGDHVKGFIDTLAISNAIGVYWPCRHGSTDVGAASGLGTSCFALKTMYSLGQWEDLSPEIQSAWCQTIRNYQVSKSHHFYRPFQYPFIDRAIHSAVQADLPWHERMKMSWMPPSVTSTLGRLLVAETKQALATLAQVGATPEFPFAGFPLAPVAIERYLHSFDWSQPWASGGQAAALPVFLQICWPSEQCGSGQAAALGACRKFFDGLAQSETGAYYSAKPSGYGELINGAMKVLTALDWLDQPIHFPEQLIDTCLLELPAAEGCHLVDAVYVLYRCLHQTDHRRGEIERYLTSVLELIRLHHNPDGGFSYHIGRAQTSYYGAAISLGLEESDLHGTTLLVWALAMIGEVIPNRYYSWQVIRP